MTMAIPVTGLSQLGGVLADVGKTYERNARQDQLLAQQRAQQLQDVQSQRDYQDRVRREERTGHIQDEATMAVLRQGMALKGALINEGLLNPADQNNPQAVSDAWQEMQRRGLDKVYGELLSTPGEDGRPLLTQEDLTNPAAVNEAKNKLGALKAKVLQTSMEQPENADRTLNDLNQQIANIRAQKDAATARANQPVPQYAPTDPKVMALASQMAEQAKPGSGRNREAIAAMAPMAQKQLNEQAMLAHAQDVQSAKIELESLRRSEAEMTGTMERIMSTFKRAPSKTPPAAVLQSPTAPVPKSATAQDLAAAINKMVGTQTPAAPAAGTATILENPTNNPVIARGNDEIRRQKTVALQSTLNDTIQEGQQIDAELQRAASPVNTTTPAGVLGGGMVPYRPPDPVVQGQQTAALLKRKADNERRRRELEAQLQGPSSVDVASPTVNTPTSSTPMWWQAPTTQPALP
jgi:hypothetical protein